LKVIQVYDTYDEVGFIKTDLDESQIKEVFKEAIAKKRNPRFNFDSIIELFINVSDGIFPNNKSEKYKVDYFIDIKDGELK